MSITRINNNIASINANRNLSATSGQLQKSIERLSSGLRINRAGDDAAGMTVVTRIQAQVRGLERAVANAQDGMNLINVAEGALEETTNRLNRMRVLAIQAANTGVNDAQARQALQDEVFQSIDEITRIAETTTWNTNNLLNGDYKVVTEIKAGQDGIQNFGINIDPGPTSNTLESGVSFLHIVNTVAGRVQIIAGEGKGEQQTFATGIRDATDVAVSLGFFTDDTSLAAAALGGAAALDGNAFNGVSIASGDAIAFDGVIADGVTKFNGRLSLDGALSPDDLASAINDAISQAETGLFGATVDTGFDISAYYRDGRIHISTTDGLTTHNLASINIRLIDADGSGDVLTQRLGVSRTSVDTGGIIGFDTTVDNNGQVGNNVLAITGSTFDTGQFEVLVEDVQGETQRMVENTVRFNDLNGVTMGRDVTLIGTAGMNGRFENGIYTGFTSLVAGDTITMEGANYDGTTFSRVYTLTTADGTDVDGQIATISGLIRELNNRLYSNGIQGTFIDAVATFVSDGYIRVIEEIGRDDSEMNFTLRFNMQTGPTTINDDAVLLREGFTQSATFSLPDGDRIRASAGDVITLRGPESTIEGIPTQQVTLRVGDNLTAGTDIIEVTAPEYVGRLNGGPAVTFTNGDQDVVFIDDGSGEKGVARTLTLDFDNILDITKSDTQPDPGTTILISTINRSMNFHIGAYSEQNFRISLGDLTAENLGFGKGSGRTVRDIEITTVTGANEALKIIDEALDQVNRTRSLLGAATNRLESTVSNQSVAIENLTASESRLRDADIAQESSTFASNQVRLQAAVSVLAQANFTPQSFLSLLG